MADDELAGLLTRMPPGDLTIAFRLQDAFFQIIFSLWIRYFDYEFGMTQCRAAAARCRPAAIVTPDKIAIAAFSSLRRIAFVSFIDAPQSCDAAAIFFQQLRFEGRRD